MYTKLSISKFRGLRNARTEKLNKVNLITGLNGAGKTSILEALQLHAHPLDASSLLQLDQLRTGNPAYSPVPGASAALPWAQIFGDDSEPIKIAGSNGGRSWSVELATQSGKDNRHTAQPTLQPGAPINVPVATLRMRVDERGELRGSQDVTVLANGGLSLGPTYIGPKGVADVKSIRLTANFRNTGFIAAQYSQLIGTDAEDMVLEIAQRVDRRIRRLLVLTNGQNTTIHADIGERRILELPLISDGLTRVITAAISISSCRDGAFLFDEFENGVHHSILTEVWRGLRQAARMANVQIFTTTHSNECISSAYEAFVGSEDLTLHRVDATESGTAIYAFEGEMIEAALSSAIDLR